MGGVDALASLPYPRRFGSAIHLLRVEGGVRLGQKGPFPGSKGCVLSTTLLQVSKYLLIKLNALPDELLRSRAVQ